MPLFLLHAALLAGCATDGTTSSSGSTRQAAPAAPRYNLTGYSAGFKQGYGDACAGRRSEQRYKSDGDYQMGWNDGRSLCRK